MILVMFISIVSANYLDLKKDDVAFIRARGVGGFNIITKNKVMPANECWIENWDGGQGSQLKSSGAEFSFMLATIYNAFNNNQTIRLEYRMSGQNFLFENVLILMH